MWWCRAIASLQIFALYVCPTLAPICLPHQTCWKQEWSASLIYKLGIWAYAGPGARAGFETRPPAFLISVYRGSFVYHGNPTPWTTANFYSEMGMGIEIQLQRQPNLVPRPCFIRINWIRRPTFARTETNWRHGFTYSLDGWISLHWYWHSPETQAPAACCPFFAAEIGEHTRNQKVMYKIRIDVIWYLFICSWDNKNTLK